MDRDLLAHSLAHSELGRTPARRARGELRPEADDDAPMTFNIWLVLLLAAMPIFVLFAGMAVAGAFIGQGDGPVLFALVSLALGLAALARRAALAGRVRR